MPVYKLGGDGNYYDNLGNALYGVNTSGPLGKAHGPAAVYQRMQQEAAARERANAPKPLRERVFDAAQQAQVDYKAAVQSQMDQVFQGYKERRDAAAAQLKTMGNTNIADINSKYDAMLGQTRSRANASGMGGTTALAGEEAMIERERQAALARARSQRTGMEIDTMAQLEGDRIRAIENMNITPPDMSTLLELARMEGQATQDQLQPAAWGGGGGMAPMMMDGSALYGIPSAAYGFQAGNMINNAPAARSNRAGPSAMRQASYAAARSGYKNVADWQAAGGYGSSGIMGIGATPAAPMVQQSAKAKDAEMRAQYRAGTLPKQVNDRLDLLERQRQQAAEQQRQAIEATLRQQQAAQQAAVRATIIPTGQAVQSGFGSTISNTPAALAGSISGGINTIASVGALLQQGQQAAADQRARQTVIPRNTPVYRPDPNATPAPSVASVNPMYNGTRPTYPDWTYTPPPPAYVPTMPQPFDPREFAKLPSSPPPQEFRYPTYEDLMSALRQAQGGGY